MGFGPIVAYFVVNFRFLLDFLEEVELGRWSVHAGSLGSKQHRDALRLTAHDQMTMDFYALCTSYMIKYSQDETSTQGKLSSLFSLNRF